MTTRINIPVMERYLHMDGAVLEMGVCNGNSSVLMAPVCKELGKDLILVDGFGGMPNSPDKTDRRHYPIGKFNFSHQEERVRAKVGPDPKIIKGWLPEALSLSELRGPFCFVYLDLDHYHSTSLCLPALWPRLTGGILCDDCNGRKILADRAVSEFITFMGCDWEDTGNNQILLKKRSDHGKAKTQMG